MTYENTNFISGYDLDGDNEMSFHSIVVDSQFMNDIGLSVFTTGQLYQWATNVNENGDFINLRYFNNFKLNLRQCLNDDGNFDKQKFITNAQVPLNAILGNGTQFTECGSTGFTSPGTFSGWRKDDNLFAGEYVPFNNTFMDNPSNNWKITTTGPNGQASYTKDDLFLSQIPAGLDTIISKIIYLNELYATNPNEFNAGGYGNARKAFLDDIKSSKERYVEWKFPTRFFLHLGIDTDQVDQGCFTCENVIWRLYLYDNGVVRDTSRTITIAQPLIVAPKKDATGRTYLHKEDGKVQPLSLTPNPAQSVAAPIGMVWNEYDNSWESGTQQILAMISTNILPATYPTLEKVLTQSTDELARPTNTFIFPTGKAIPISMQNGNPLQWGPDYLKPEPCRGDFNDKVELVVQNSSLKTWVSGEVAMLQKINGVWIPSEIARPSEDPVYDTPVSAKWDFMYLMTNAHHFFRTRTGDTAANLFTYQQYEDAFYKKYYEIPNFPGYTKVANSYFQVTSFDFMGPNIGGLRNNAHALACTHFEIDPTDTPLENNGQYVNGDASAPFFGCIFPDGYNTNGKYDEYNTNNHVQINPRTSSTRESGVFFIKIPKDKKIFENINANIGTANAGGMFINNDSSLKHLPADIALNGSPSGINGCPIKNIEHFSLFDDDNTPNKLKDKIRNYFSSYGNGNWLYRDNNELDSAFDFKPINQYRIQFRPLKLELYANFEHQNIDSANSKYNSNEYGEFGAQCWKIVNDNESPVSLTAYQRNLFNNTNFNFGFNSLLGETILPGSIYKGLGYNISAFTTQPYSNFNPLPPDTAKFSRYWWGNFRKWTLEGPRPAGAVGIIGANCTIVANSKINFSTQNYIGVGSMFNIAEGSFDPILDFLGIPRTPWEPAWGGYGGDNYNALQTTQLFARVFQAWPRHLTIYDPRFFAVHHFNDGVGLCSDTNSNVDLPNPTSPCPEKELYFKGSKVTTIPPSFEIKYPDGYYWVDKTLTSVDMKIPTFYKSDGKSSIVDLRDRVYFDQAMRASETYLWRYFAHWAIDPQRRGKLLPYNLKARTICLPDKNENVKSWVKDESLPAEVSTLDFDIIILDQGKGYKSGDTFTVSGGSGKSVNYILELTEECTDQSGAIKKFIIKSSDYTYGYSTNDFLSIQDVLAARNDKNKITSTSIKIVPLSVRGTGFKGGFIRGIIYDVDFTDQKPKEAGDIQLIKLTPNSPSYFFTGSTKFIDPVSDSVEQSINIVNKSPDGKYDIFLHFHNDISHTAMKDWSNGAGGPLAVENQVTLTITSE